MEILPESTSNRSTVGTNDGVAASFQQSLIHYHMLMLKLQRHTISIKIQESRNLKNQRQRLLQNSNIKDLSSKTKLGGRLTESFQDDAKYEHVDQDTRSQGGKDDQDKQGKDLKISELKSKSKRKGSRSKITKHEGTSLQQNKEQDSRTQCQRNLKKPKTML
ncbi:hypothetical protein Tco_1385258 [Tanacetum coccineum]